MMAGGFLSQASSLKSQEWLGIGLLLVWNWLPFLLVGYVARRLSASPRSLWTLQAAATVLTIGVAIVVYRVFVSDTADSQSGLAVMFLPVAQLAVSVPFLGLALVLRNRKVPPN
jgi:predicted permease